MPDHKNKLLALRGAITLQILSLHQIGSNNQIGLYRNIDKISFYPYSTIKCIGRRGNEQQRSRRKLRCSSRKDIEKEEEVEEKRKTEKRRSYCVRMYTFLISWIQ
jgi:hypothetical protein